MGQTDALEQGAVEEPPLEANPFFYTRSVDLSFTNKIVLSPQRKTFTATPVPSLSQPEHGKLKALRGTKLDPLCALLAMQPAIVNTTIIDISRLMLNLDQNIRQQESSDSRFTKPLNNRDSGGQPAVATESGDNPPQEFIPRSVRIKNPVFCSNVVKEDK